MSTPAWAPTPHLIAPQPRLRPSLFDPVARLAELMPNWDGYQGKPPSAAVLKMTIRVLAALPPQVPDPEVLPSTDGGVLLEWDMSGVELLLGLDDQALHTAVVSIDGSGEQEGPAVGLHDAIVDALGRLADRGGSE